MECPYCKKEMREGFLYASQSAPVWCPGPANEPFPPDSSMNLTEPGLFTEKRAESWYCQDCKILITPVREYETTWDKMKDKWKDFTEKLAKDREERAEEHREQQQEKARNKRRKSDPWEG